MASLALNARKSEAMISPNVLSTKLKEVRLAILLATVHVAQHAQEVIQIYRLQHY